MKSLQSIFRTALFSIGLFAVFGPLMSLVIWSFAERWHWPALFPQDYGSFYWRRAAEGDVFQALGLSLQISVITTVCALALTVPLAYAIAKKKFPFRMLIMVLFLLPQAFPQLPILTNTVRLFYRWNLVGTLGGVVLVHLAGGMLYALWVMIAVFQSIPQNLENAAHNLGASPVRSFISITLPLAAPGIIASTILVFLYSFDEFTGTLLIGSPFLQPLSVFMYHTSLGYEMQIASVSALILTIPGLLMLFLLERFLKAEYLSGFGKS